MKCMRKIFLGMVCLAFVLGPLVAESEVSTKLGVRFLISGDIGGVFDGGDATYSGGVLGGLFLAPHKKLTLTNVPVSEYRTTALDSGFTGFSLPNMSDLDPTEMYLISSNNMQKAIALQKSFDEGKITEESYNKSRQSLDKASKTMAVKLKARVTESSFSQLDKISFGIISGYYGTSYKGIVEETNIMGRVTEEKKFIPIKYIPIMASVQHNFYVLYGNMRHISTKVEIPYETPEISTWSYSNSQAYLFYRISAGAGLIQEITELPVQVAPVFRVEVGFGSRDGFFSILNTTIGYQQLVTNLTTKGVLFINWCLLLS